MRLKYFLLLFIFFFSFPVNSLSIKRSLRGEATRNFPGESRAQAELGYTMIKFKNYSNHYSQWFFRYGLSKKSSFRVFAELPVFSKEETKDIEDKSFYQNFQTGTIRTSLKFLWTKFGPFALGNYFGFNLPTANTTTGGSLRNDKGGFDQLYFYNYFSLDAQFSGFNFYYNFGIFRPLGEIYHYYSLSKDDTEKFYFPYIFGSSFDFGNLDTFSIFVEQCFDGDSPFYPGGYFTGGIAYLLKTRIYNNYEFVLDLSFSSDTMGKNKENNPYIYSIGLSFREGKAFYHEKAGKINLW